MNIDINGLTVNSDIPNTKKLVGETIEVEFSPTKDHLGNKNARFTYGDSTKDKSVTITEKKLIEGNIQFGNYKDGKWYSKGGRDVIDTVGTITPEHGTRTLKYGSKKPLDFYISSFLIYSDKIVIDIPGLQVKSFSLTLDKFNLNFKKSIQDKVDGSYYNSASYQYEIAENQVITEVNNFIQVNKIYKYSIYNEVDFIFDKTDLYFITVGKDFGSPVTYFSGFESTRYGSVNPNALSNTNASFKSIQSIYNPDSFSSTHNFQIVVNENENLKKSFLEIDLGYDVKYFESPSKLNFDKPEYGDPNTFEAKTADSGWCLFFDGMIEGDFVPLKIKLLERKLFKVKFEVGPNARPIEAKEYDPNSNLGEIDIYPNEGYEFKGFYTDKTFVEDTLVDEDMLVESDITLYAYVTNEKFTNPKSPQECDHFFINEKDFKRRIRRICDKYNGDLSEVTLGFSNKVKEIPYVDINIRRFPDTIVKAPKMIFGRNITDLDECFASCGKLTTIPPTIFDKCTQVTNFIYCFRYCEALVEIPAGLFDKCINAKKFGGCFERCSSLTTVPITLFDKCTKVERFGSCFYYCSSVTSAIPDAWNAKKFPVVVDHKGYAQGCNNASNYKDIPDGWKGY